MDNRQEPVNIYRKNPLGIAPTGKPFRAIIVDDSATVRVMLKQILRSVDFDVIADVGSGHEAIEGVTSRALRPHFAFVDLEMPGIDGIQVVREIRQALPECKIIMVTSHSDKARVEELVKLGINGYIKKPFDRDQVLVTIAKTVPQSTT